MRNILVVCVAIVFGFAWIGCGSNPPEILQYVWEVNLMDPTGDWSGHGDLEEELSVFVQVEDQDGDDEVEFIYLIHDDEELYWILDKTNWESTTIGSSRWLGKSNLRMPQGEKFPRKWYRLMVVDKSGKSSEKEVILHTKRVLNPVFPTGAVVGDEYVLTSPHIEHLLSVYDATGERINEYKSDSLKIPLNLLVGDALPDQPLTVSISVVLSSYGVTLRGFPSPL